MLVLCVERDCLHNFVFSLQSYSVSRGQPSLTPNRAPLMFVSQICKVSPYIRKLRELQMMHFKFLYVITCKLVHDQGYVSNAPCNIHLDARFLLNDFCSYALPIVCMFKLSDDYLTSINYKHNFSLQVIIIKRHVPSD